MVNQVHLCGTIGKTQIGKIDDLEMARFTVAPEFIYRIDKEGTFDETDWYPCVALLSDKIPDLTIFVEKCTVDLQGRLIFGRFKDSEEEVPRWKMYVKVYEAKILWRPGD